MKPATRFRKVLFPHPLGPTRHKNSLSSTVRHRSDSARVPPPSSAVPYCLPTWTATIWLISCLPGQPTGDLVSTAFEKFCRRDSPADPRSPLPQRPYLGLRSSSCPKARNRCLTSL